MRCIEVKNAFACSTSSRPINSSERVEEILNLWYIWWNVLLIVIFCLYKFRNRGLHCCFTLHETTNFGIVAVGFCIFCDRPWTNSHHVWNIHHKMLLCFKLSKYYCIDFPSLLVFQKLDNFMRGRFSSTRSLSADSLLPWKFRRIENPRLN